MKGRGIMIILIAGASHTGKTALADRLIKRYGYPCLSIDHLKMGLIRSQNTSLTPTSNDEELTAYLWPIVREMIKTAIENDQHLIVEGCYIPFDWQRGFSEEYLAKIKYYCLIMSEKYVKNHFDEIEKYANVVEKRMFDECDVDVLISDNEKNLRLAKENNVNYILIDEEYKIDVE